jgi:hypothetical protein
MAKRAEQTEAFRPERVRLSAKESLKRLREFPKRKEHFIAAIRKGKDRFGPLARGGCINRTIR